MLMFRFSLLPFQFRFFLRYLRRFRRRLMPAASTFCWRAPSATPPGFTPPRQRAAPMPRF
jgi:hypothetical protein